jgi:hypothetical protein
MPNLKLTREEAEATVAYLKWMSAVDGNGFPIHFGQLPDQLGRRAKCSDPSGWPSALARR